MENGKLKMENYLLSFDFVVFTILTSNRMGSSQSLCKELKAISKIYWLSFKSINQYSVSFAPLSAIFILFKKSAFDCVCSAYLISVPIEIPFRSICFDKIYSFFSSNKNSYRFTHLNANLYDLGAKILSIINNNLKVKTNNKLRYKFSGSRETLILNFSLSILN